MRSVFEDRIISRRAEIVLPTRICDLTPLDYYLWGAVKDKRYVDKPETTLKDNIREAMVKYSRSCRLMHGQPRQPFEWNYFIDLSNNKRYFRKYSVHFFFKAFSKKVIWQPCCWLCWVGLWHRLTVSKLFED